MEDMIYTVVANGTHYYYETDMFKRWTERTNFPFQNVCHVAMERYIFNDCFGVRVAYCRNSIPPYARMEKTTGSSWFDTISPDSYIIGSDEAGCVILDKECPKIAWGFTAFLMACLFVDEKGRYRYRIGGKNASVMEIMQAYHSNMFGLYRALNKDDYSYYKENGYNEECDNLNKRFAVEHVRSEIDLLERTREKAFSPAVSLIARASGYISWVRGGKTDSYPVGLLHLFRNRTDLINTLTGDDDRRTARKITEWANKGFIENPRNATNDVSRVAFARELKKAGLIRCSERTFRDYL